MNKHPWNDNSIRCVLAIVIVELVMIAHYAITLCQPHETMHFTAENLQMQGGAFLEDGSFFIGEESGITDATVLSTGKMTLQPGVYEVYLAFTSQAEQLTEVCSASAGYGALLSNAVTMRIDSQMDHVTYRFTVNRTVTDVEVIVRYLGGGDLRITAFTVRDTGLASAKVLVALLPLMLLFDVCIWQYMVRKKRLCREQKQVILALGAIALIASLPIFVEYLRTGDDVYFHMNRIAGLAEAWRAGQFPVRIQYWWLYGAGYPISVMYGDFFLWIPAFLHLCGYDLPQSYLLWLLFWNLASAGIAYVSFRGIFRSRSAGLLGSALYTLSLYRLYNVHIRVAIGEYTAMTFLPLAVYGFVLLLQDHKERIRKSNASIILALAYSGMLLSHVLTLEIATISGALICLVNTRRLFRKESMLALLKAILLAVGLTAWFLIPFTDYFLHVDMGVFHVEREIQKFGLYLPQFLTCFPWMGGNTVFYEQGMTDIRPAAAGIGLLIGFLAVCKKRLVEKTYFRQHSRRTLISTAFGCALITSLMTLNSFPWDAFQSLSDTTYRLGASLQFPWRLLMLVTISMCIVIVADVTEMQRHGAQTRQAGAEWHSGAADHGTRRCRIYVTALVSLTMLSGLFLMNHDLQIRPISTMREASCMGADVMGAREYLIDGTIYELLDEVHYTASDAVTIDDYHRQAGVVTLTASAQNSGYVDVPLMNYPHVIARDTATGEVLESTSNEQNLVRVMFPEGYQGEIRIALEEPFFWRAGEVLTLLTLLGAAIKGIRTYADKKRNSGGVQDAHL